MIVDGVLFIIADSTYSDRLRTRLSKPLYQVTLSILDKRIFAPFPTSTPHSSAITVPPFYISFPEVVVLSVIKCESNQ